MKNACKVFRPPSLKIRGDKLLEILEMSNEYERETMTGIRNYPTIARGGGGGEERGQRYYYSSPSPPLR